MTTLPPRRAKVAYIMSRFPKLTETFVLFEMLAVERQGAAIELFPLLRERTQQMHPEARALLPRARFQPFLSWSIVGSNLSALVRRPRTYLVALAVLLRANCGSRRYLTGALGIFPKSVHFAAQMTAAGVTHVHAHFASHPAAAAWIIHRLTGIPYSFTAHGSDLHRDRHMLREKVAEAAFVVPISEFNRRVIVATCGERTAAKLAVIHCGVDTAVFRPPQRAALTAARRAAAVPFSVHCVGTLHEVKGQGHLIEACRLLRTRGRPVICHFIGDGPDAEQLARQAREAGLAGHVVFHGHCTRKEVVKLLGEADAVAAPSVPTRNGRREGIPVALMEAMASGVPVVASRLSGIPELVEDGVTGLLVSPGEPGELAAALERLQAEPATRQRLAGAAREKVEREFDLESNAAELLECILGGGPGGAA